jgi:hypothetical protein
MLSESRLDHPDLDHPFLLDCCSNEVVFAWYKIQLTNGQPIPTFVFFSNAKGRRYMLLYY